MKQETDDLDIRSDAASIGAGRVVDRHAAGSRLWSQGDVTRHVVLLLGGRVRLVARTAFGDTTVVELPAPCLVGAAEVLSGRERSGSLEAANESETVRVGENEVRTLLSARTPAGAAFRRLLILSETQAIRLTNDSLGSFFADPNHSKRARDLSASGAFPAVVEGQPADSGKVLELFERLGIAVPLLLRFGLVERTYPEGARLTRTGEPATEAFLTCSGRVRISIKIPGVGEEALSILGPGEMVGEMGLVDGAARSAYAIAHDGPVTVFAMNRTVFRRLLRGDVEGSAPLVSRIASSLSRRFEETAARAVSFFVLSGGAGSDRQEAAGLDFDVDVDGLFQG